MSIIEDIHVAMVAFPSPRNFWEGKVENEERGMEGNSGYIGKDREDVFLFWKNANSNGKYIISAPF
jgi:hypothetical protein